MKKLDYKEPVMTVVMISHQAHLLAGSGEEAEYGAPIED